MPGSFPSELQPVVQALLQAQDEDQLDDVLDNAVLKVPGFEAQSRTFFTCGEYQFLSGLQVNTDEYAEKLKAANRMGLASAPELVRYITTPDGASLTITRTPGSAFKNLVPYNEMADRIPEEARKRFIKDMEALIDQGHIHEQALNGPSVLRMDTVGQRIYVDDWSRMRPLDDDADKAELKQRLRQRYS